MPTDESLDVSGRVSGCFCMCLSVFGLARTFFHAFSGAYGCFSERICAYLQVFVRFSTRFWTSIGISFSVLERLLNCYWRFLCESAHLCASLRVSLSDSEPFLALSPQCC